ncbi:hypothetical protein F5148DRAFT_501275 [Russula earlei]|uniref:Uncharacterized protein n=1 Tax=Russula earlei TaxID=71964 RepID=A0ACC0TXG6_9AGAM|nr:hypothetical protein F5148DRAFT_501275 [Russula earlei]
MRVTRISCIFALSVFFFSASSALPCVLPPALKTVRSSPALQAAFFAHDHSRVRVRVRTPSPHSNGPGSTAVMMQSSRRSMGVSPFEFSSRGAHVRGHLQAHRGHSPGFQILQILLALISPRTHRVRTLHVWSSA